MHQLTPKVLNINSQMYNNQHAFQPWKGETFIATATTARITQTLKGWNDIVLLLGEMVLFNGGFVVHYVVIMRRTADNLQHITLSGFL